MGTFQNLMLAYENGAASGLLTGLLGVLVIIFTVISAVLVPFVSHERAW
ncbi:MAG: hypothetical protein FWE16_02355 [Firmicutes bacterium]|nr:hypothetical protein [Bacillota bacterium]